MLALPAITMEMIIINLNWYSVLDRAIDPCGCGDLPLYTGSTYITNSTVFITVYESTHKKTPGSILDKHTNYSFEYPNRSSYPSHFFFQCLHPCLPRTKEQFGKRTSLGGGYRKQALHNYT